MEPDAEPPKERHEQGRIANEARAPSHSADTPGHETGQDGGRRHRQETDTPAPAPQQAASPDATDAAFDAEAAPEPAAPVSPETPAAEPVSLDETPALPTAELRTPETGGRPRAEGAAMPERAQAPFLRAALGAARRLSVLPGGWNVLEMPLDEGDGTLTIRARREDGRVAVALGFSDPELRAHAAAHADRLQQLLQAEYETTVDFTLLSGDGGAHADGDDPAERGQPARGGGSIQAGEAAPEAPARRVLPAGTRHEWIG
ncbi:MAG: hypothetical protein R3247_08625 [Rhodothermales bacterium]|nr:hypothetical protein [Rhodothermales bacterium]